MKLINIFMLSGILIFTVFACARPLTGSSEESLKIAEKFVKGEATFQSDGIPDTLKLVSSTPVNNGWQYIFEFDSRYAGYGNRSGQVLAEVITHHAAEITIQEGQVTLATLDGQWNMIDQCANMEIKLAPIEEVKVNILKSNPAQIGVYIKGGLPDGCTTFHDIDINREGSTVNIIVTVQRPRGMSCPAIYTYFEKDIIIESDFDFGTTYTLNVNDYSTIFEGTLVKTEGRCRR